MKKIYNKLVRDKIPEIIASNGDKAKTRILNDKDYFKELVNKLDEECQEFKDDLSIEELADIQEVVLALADQIASRGKLEKVRSTKAAKRGGFEQKIFLEEVDDE